MKKLASLIVGGTLLLSADDSFASRHSHQGGRLYQYVRSRNVEIEPRAGIIGIGIVAGAIIAIGIASSYRRERKTGKLPEYDD